LLYRSANAGVPTESFAAASTGFTYQTVDIPGNVYEKSAASALKLRMEYSLTLMKASSQFDIAAIDGLLRAPEIGLCSSQPDQDAITVRCKRVGRTPFCFSATLYGSDGSHNPEVLKCEPDYRPYLPALTNVLGFYGIDLPVRDRYGLAHYAVDASGLATAYVHLKIYGERDHFKRTLLVSPFRMDEWRATAR
jgi:hypothetical protein